MKGWLGARDMATVHGSIGNLEQKQRRDRVQLIESLLCRFTTLISPTSPASRSLIVMMSPVRPRSACWKVRFASANLCRLLRKGGDLFESSAERPAADDLVRLIAGQADGEKIAIDGSTNPLRLVRLATLPNPCRTTKSRFGVRARIRILLWPQKGRRNRQTAIAPHIWAYKMLEALLLVPP